MPFYYGSECVCFAQQQSFDRFKVSDYFSPASLLSSFIVLTANSCHHTRQNAIYLPTLILDASTKWRVKRRRRRKRKEEEEGKKKKTAPGRRFLLQLTCEENIYFEIPKVLAWMKCKATFAVEPRPHMQMWERVMRGQTGGRSQAHIWKWLCDGSSIPGWLLLLIQVADWSLIIHAVIVLLCVCVVEVGSAKV